uniref:Uncharacterized protein n=1 Tax=candidate division WOR-3 bacterium TaxID=2052148 RepID=A0A7C2K4D1_UNCW3
MRRFLLSGFVLLIFLFWACAPKEAKIEILSFSVADSIKIHDPDGDPTNSWLGGSDTVITWDSTLFSIKVKYEGPAVGYLDEIIWVLKSPSGEQIKTYEAILYPPIPMEDGQIRDLKFYISFDNKSAYRIDSLYDDTLNYFGIGRVTFYITGTTYAQYIRSDNISFDLKFIP